MKQNEQKQSIIPGNELTFIVEDIQYLPEHHCPHCGAAAITDEKGEWFTPFVDFYNTILQNWTANFGYVTFTCGTACLRFGALRVARLGGAVIALPFVTSIEEAKVLGHPPAVLNAQRVSQALGFLAAEADETQTAGEDFLMLQLVALLRGQLSPEHAAEQLHRWAALTYAERAEKVHGAVDLAV